MDKLKGFGRSKGFFLLSGILILLAMMALPPARGASAKEGKAAKGGEAGQTPITITSQSMKADRTSKTIVFKGDVEAREDFLLCSDELYMHYTDSNEVQKIDARGHVKIYRAAGFARAKRAVYDRVEHTLLLTGDAVIERCSDTVKGDKITLYLDDDSALVEGLNKGRVTAVIVPGKKCAGEVAGKKGGVDNGAADGVFDVKNTHCNFSR